MDKLTGTLLDQGASIGGVIPEQGLPITGVLPPMDLALTGTLSSLGLRGKSAYQIACDYGFQGTEEEWIDSLKKEKIQTKVDEHNVIWYKYVHEEENEWKVFFEMGGFLQKLAKVERDMQYKQDVIPGYTMVKITEIERLAKVDNYDDTEVRQLIAAVGEALSSSDAEFDNFVEEANGKLDSINASINTINTSIDNIKSDINGINTNINEIENDIDKLETDLATTDAKFSSYRKSADQDTIDTNLQEQITASKNAIDVLNGAKTVDGSVKKQIADAVSSIINGAPNDYNTLKKIADWISDHTTKASNTDNKITELENYVGTIPEGVTATNIVDYIAEACTDLISNADLDRYATLEYLNSVKDEINNSKADKAELTAHNSSSTAHEDIRELISGLTTKLNTLADSDDETLDQLSEIVAYIKSNKELIDGVTTGKVNVSDIVDNLVSENTNKPLSAKQGKALKDLIDAIVIPTKVSELTNDSGYLTEHQSLDNYYTKEQVDDVAAKSGKVKTVNNNEPDEAGNVTVEIPDVSGKADKEDLEYVIYHEDGDDPDENDDEYLIVTDADMQQFTNSVNNYTKEVNNLQEETASLKEDLRQKIDEVNEKIDSIKNVVLGVIVDDEGDATLEATSKINVYVDDGDLSFYRIDNGNFTF